MTIPQAFDLATRQHQTGQLKESEQLCRQILAQQPQHADALHLLGMIAGQAGRADVAMQLIRQAISLRPNWAEAHSNLGNALSDTGRWDEAIAVYRQALALKPNFALACYNLGNTLAEKGARDDAIAAWRQAIALKPNYAAAYNNLANALKDLGKLDEAIAAWRQAIACKPDSAGAYNNLGAALHELGQLDQAIAACRQAIALKPNYPEALNNLGNSLKENGQLAEAIATFRQAIALNPNYSEPHSNLGVALKESGHLDQAIAAYKQAIALKPNDAEAYQNLGNALQETSRPREALAAYRQAISIKPNWPEAHGSMSSALLAQGDFAQGWEEYEWRWQSKLFLPARRPFTQPQWDGSPLAGRTILLHAEQGFGDTLQFTRYLPLVARRGGRVIVECQPELARLIQTIDAGIPVIARGQPLPAFDLHCPLLSLPRMMSTTLASIPHQAPYLHPDANDVAKQRDRLANPSPATKVGLVWAGRPTHKNDRNRSLKLANLAPLAQIPSMRFYSLQKGDAAAEAKTPPPSMELIDATAGLEDFADTAALIANLDLVIAVDTAVAHLAGALAKPVWTLLPHIADWRWLLERDDSPWYPTMRLFRQPSSGDWDNVVRRVAAALANWVQRR